MPHINTIYHSSNFEYSQLRKNIREARKQLKMARENGIKFDVIVVTGISGIAFGTLLSYLEHIPLLIIRKEEESSHGLNLEGYLPEQGDTVLWIDDFICGGSTGRRVISKIHGVNGFNAQNNVWAYLYRTGCEEYHSGAHAHTWYGPTELMRELGVT
jgi:orotate phosphoribosyltransferase